MVRSSHRQGYGLGVYNLCDSPLHAYGAWVDIIGARQVADTPTIDYEGYLRGLSEAGELGFDVMVEAGAKRQVELNLKVKSV